MLELAPGRLFNFLRRERGTFCQFLASKWHYLYFYLKPNRNYNIKIQKPYSYVLTWIFPSRKWEVNSYDFERTLCLYCLTMSHCIKESYRPYTSRILYQVPKHIFSRGSGALIWRGHLLQLLSLGRGARSKRGTYLKLGTNTSINGNLGIIVLFFIWRWQDREQISYLFY